METATYCRILEDEEGVFKVFTDEDIFESILGGGCNSALTKWLMEQGYLDSNRFCTSKGKDHINGFIENHKSSVFKAIKNHQEDQDRTAMFLDAGLRGDFSIQFVIDSLIEMGLLTKADNGDLYIK